MNGLPIPFRGTTLHILPSGGLYWPAQSLLCVSDLHFGKSNRIARREGMMLPPYETLETLDRLGGDLGTTNAKTVICLGDSFDDLTASRDMTQALKDRLISLMAGRHWIWVEGNHDPGPLDLPGTHLGEVQIGGLMFRHIAAPNPNGEISGHYHPKARVVTRGRSLSRRCVLVDAQRMVLPAFGTYTGGLFCDRPPLSALFGDGAKAILLDKSPLAIPMPRAHQSPKPASRKAGR